MAITIQCYTTKLEVTGETDLTLVNHTTKHALNVVSYVLLGDSGIITLDNGVKVPAHGIDNPGITSPGRIAQTVRVSAFGRDYWKDLVNRYMQYCNLIITTLDTQTEYEAPAIFDRLADVTPFHNPRVEYARYSLGFDILDEFTVVTP
jgi:hypothetical protein